MTTYVLMGYTRGDDLIRSEAKPLFSSPDRATCEAKLISTQRERNEWLDKNEHTVPYYARCSIWARFEVVETRF